MDQQGDSRVDSQATLTSDVMTKFVVNNRTDALKTDINLFLLFDNKLLNGPLSLVDASHK